MALSLRGMPLAVLVSDCDESPTAYADATQSSGRTGMSSKPRTGMSSKQSTSAAINRRMRDPRFTWLDALGELKFATLQRSAAETHRLTNQTKAAVLVPN